jgi:hypothetical protein
MARVAHPIPQHVWYTREESGLAHDLAREPAGHEDRDHHRAPAQRATVVTAGTEVDRRADDILSVVVAAPALALRRGKEVGEQLPELAQRLAW